MAGSPVGLLDPLTIIGAEEGHALHLDFSTLEQHQVAIPPGAASVVVHSAGDPDVGAAAVPDQTGRMRAGRQPHRAPAGPLRPGRPGALAEPVLYAGGRFHVITECAWVREVERLLARGNLAGVGAVMTDGHRSLAEDYRVSLPVVDELVDALVRTPGVYGARMTGGGFGGCVIALCEDGSPALRPEMHAPRRAWRVSPARGAALLGT